MTFEQDSVKNAPPHPKILIIEIIYDQHIQWQNLIKAEKMLRNFIPGKE